MKILERLNPTNTGSYNRPIAHALGLGAAVVYSALISKYEYYYKHNMLDEEGFFYSKIADLEESTTLTKRQQRAAIKVLIDKGLIKRKRCGMPAKRYFRVLDDTEPLDEYMKEFEKSLIPPLPLKSDFISPFLTLRPPLSSSALTQIKRTNADTISSKMTLGLTTSPNSLLQ